MSSAMAIPRFSEASVQLAAAFRGAWTDQLTFSGKTVVEGKNMNVDFFIKSNLSCTSVAFRSTLRIPWHLRMSRNTPWTFAFRLVPWVIFFPPAFQKCLEDFFSQKRPKIEKYRVEFLSLSYSRPSSSQTLPWRLRFRYNTVSMDVQILKRTKLNRWMFVTFSCKEVFSSHENECSNDDYIYSYPFTTIEIVITKSQSVSFIQFIFHSIASTFASNMFEFPTKTAC